MPRRASHAKTFDVLMGSALPPDEKFIQTHARDVQNLDV